MVRSACSAAFEAIRGWLKGAVEAETLERRIDEAASAYAGARVRPERPVGFAPRSDEDRRAGR